MDDGDNLHVLPIVTRGPTENVNSLLYLRGVDMAVINTDVLDEYKAQVPNIQQQITYILNLFPSELHIFVRPEIQSLDDLKGKKVNFNTLGTAAAYSGPLIFTRLGLDVNKTFIPHQVALEQMKSGGMDAVVFITSKPVDAFLKGRWEGGFKFLPVEYDNRLADYYLPSRLEPTDYPALVPEGSQVPTIAVPTFLAAYNWPRNSDRHKRMERFVDRLFSRLETLQGPGFDGKWKGVNLAVQGAGAGALPFGPGVAGPSQRHGRKRPDGRFAEMRRFAILPLMLSLTVLVADRGHWRRIPPATDAAEWVISETRSPVDYSPQISAMMASSPSPGNWGMSFSLHCRQGRTEALFVIPDFARFPAGASFPVEYFTVSQEAIRSRSVERRWVERRGVEKRLGRAEQFGGRRLDGRCRGVS